MQSFPLCALSANTCLIGRREKLVSSQRPESLRTSLEFHCNGRLHLQMKLSFLINSQPLGSTPPRLISYSTVPRNREKKQRAVYGNSGEFP
jgi:hypothetical protein